MTKKELLAKLEDWPDKTRIEISVAVNTKAEDLQNEDKVWLEIAGVEEANYINTHHVKHCLIYTGRVTMG